MQLRELAVRNLRILENTQFVPGPGVNLVVGANGSGKTSLLEAIHFLSRTRSFRSGRLSDVLRHGTDLLAVEGRVRSAVGDEVSLAVRRSGKDLRALVGGRGVDRATDLARRLPLALVLPSSTGLLDAGPRDRRRLLDWVLFHVEPGYLDVWQDYHRLMRQRNAGLRRGDRGLGVWESRMAASAMQLHRLRESAVTGMQVCFDALSAGMLPVPLELGYRAGWEVAEPLEAQWEARRDDDRHAGFTQVGPHRMDLVLRAGPRAASRVLSRGQAKLAVLALIGASAKSIGERTGEAPVFLLDDFGAELDAEHAGLLAKLVSDVSGQAIVTTTDVANARHWSGGELRVFHVEHGLISADVSDG